jgi:hypothetical protein
MSVQKTLPHKYLIAASVIIPVLMFAFMMWQDYNYILNNARNNAITTANVFQQHAFNVVETHQLIIEQVNGRIAGLSWDEIARSKEIHTYLEKIEKKYPQVQGIWLLDSSGTVRNASKILPDKPINVAERDYFQSLREKDTGLFIGHIIKPKILNNLNFNIASRRGNGSATFDGVIVVTVFPEYFSNFWNSVTPMKNTASVLIRSDGSILSRSRGIKLDRLTLPADSPQMKAIRSADRGSLIAISVNDEVKRFFAFQKVGKYNLYIMHGVDMSSIVHDWQEHLVRNGIYFVIAIVILVLLAISVTSHAKRELVAMDGLRESEERLALAADAGQVGMFVLNMATGDLCESACNNDPLLA